MGDEKKKNSWFSWVVISVVFLAFIYFFLFTIMKNSQKQARELVRARIVKDVSVWGEIFSDELDSSRKFGAVIRDGIDNKGKDIFAEEHLEYADLLIKNSAYKNILFCDDEGTMIDQKGEKRDTSFYEPYLVGAEKVSVRYFYMPEDDMGNKNVFVASYPLNRGYIMFLLDSSAMDAQFNPCNYEDSSFCTIFRKDGTVLGSFGRFADVNSNFITSGNLLTAIQAGAVAEEYNYFKSKLYNTTAYCIRTKNQSDARTMICVPLSVEDWYMCFGVRQYQIDSLVKAEFSAIKGSVIKLFIVVSVFLIFIVTTFIINFSKNKEHSKKLEDKADMDLLTELTNKAATERMIAEYMQENPQGRGVLFILDIDNFKKVNDTMGHAFGDTLLKTLGKEIRTEFRVTDIVGRTGGDEFMIFLKDIKDDLIVEREANRVNHFFHDFKAGGDFVKYSATASIGAAVFPEDGANFKDLYVSADQALYRAKKRGKNQLVFFNEEKFFK